MSAKRREKLVRRAGRKDKKRMAQDRQLFKDKLKILECVIQRAEAEGVPLPMEELTALPLGAEVVKHAKAGQLRDWVDGKV